MSTILENRIAPEQRFAKRDKIEYHVFSHCIKDASTIEKWVGITRPKNVLIDPKTYEILRNNRIEWNFDEENTIATVVIKDVKLTGLTGEVKDEAINIGEVKD
tara:strand:- start:700 stop:1008 length:309 start_codon:yes stop_codon:yes gene_type:complete